MSFGWSVGDIAQAIIIVTKIVKALDDVDGAPAHYREAVSFLTSLKRTLEPLATFEGVGPACLGTAYIEEIRWQIDKIRGPVEEFINITRSYEAGLGRAADTGRHRNAGEKIRWRFYISKKVDALRRTIEGDMMILNSIQTRLILDLSMALPASFKGALEKSFTNVLLPRVATIMQEQVQPVRTKMEEDAVTRQAGHNLVISVLESHSTGLKDISSQAVKNQQDSAEFLAAKFDELNLNLGVATRNVAQQILAAAKILESKLPTKASATDTSSFGAVSSLNINPVVGNEKGLALRKSEWESLRELYYAVFLCLGYLLRDIFLALSRMVRPMTALTPQLLAKYNISFYDALGRPPRILAYENFASYRVFEAFLHDAFINRPGESWVEKGLYKLANARNGHRITAQSWAQMVAPGSHVNMSMLLNPAKANADACPDTDCGGTLVALPKKESKECSACEKHVSLAQDTETRPDSPSRARAGSQTKPDFASNVHGIAFDVPTAHPEPSTRNDGSEPPIQTSRSPGDDLLNMLDISHFKRVILALEKSQLGSVSNDDLDEMVFPSFLFQVNQLPINDDTTAGGVAPRVNENLNWIPPVYSNGFGPQVAGNLFRWESNGTISPAIDCQWVNGSFISSETAERHSHEIQHYCTRTVSWCNPWGQFMVATGDSSSRHMEYSEGPHSRWWPLAFEHDGGISRVVESGPSQYLDGSGAAWIADLGLLSHVPRRAPAATGLSGNLAILIGLIALSCPAEYFDTVLITDRPLRRHKWRGHNRGDGRSDQRGVVVHIYLDPKNPHGSTMSTLPDLEAKGPALIT